MTKFKLIDGILLVDKPVSASSNRALQQVRHGYQARKAGHTGTLDPFASGLLVCCFGQSTKVSGLLLDANKSYQACLTLGVATDTADTEGQITAQAEVPRLSEDRIRDVLDSFRGEQEQIPPMYSALKQNGKRLYELARSGIEVERKPRKVCIHDIQLVSWTQDQVEFRVRCSKGTYVRTLGESIAQTLGTLGHLSALRRLALGPFLVEHARSPGDLAAAAWPLDALLPSDSALQDWPAQHLDDANAQFFCHGRAVPAATNSQIGDEVRVYAPGGLFLGCAEHEESGLLRPKRLFVCGNQG